MKQVFLSGQGEITVLDAPVPGRLRDGALIRTAYSAISSGTEGAAVTKASGLMGIYEKATSSRDRVEQVWNMAKRDGLARTYAAVTSKLKEFSPVGYSCAGIVVETDTPAFPFQPGQRVACMGVGFASHAEYVSVPRNLLAAVPDGASLEGAAFGSIACIALQGIRRLDLSPGERVGVVGLGLIGQIAVRLLTAMGYEVFGADLNATRVRDAASVPGVTAWNIAETDGAAFVAERTRGQGLDGVMICAATDSSIPVNAAFETLRQRGRVAIVGDVGLDLDRAKMYRKELELRLSCSYGPGRYDPGYELDGRDYPLGHVRWTEGRNLEFFLSLLGSGRLSLKDLVSATFPAADAKQAFARVKVGDAYGVVIDYDAPQNPLPPSREARIVQHSSRAKGANERIGLAFIGVGSFVRGMHLPNAKRLSDVFDIRAVSSRTGASAASAANRYEAEISTSDYRILLENPSVDAVLIGTRHASHARIILDALDAGKHVYVEKPMTTTVTDGVAVWKKAEEKGLVVRVGFNRRFSPMIRALRDGIAASGPRVFTARVNIGPLGDDWSSAPEEGGRFLGEGTHFIDLCDWFMGSEPATIAAAFAEPENLSNPNGALTLRYPDGSIAQLIYTSAGSTKIGKEYFEAFGGNKSGFVNDYKSVELFGASTPRVAGGDKGQLGALREFGAAIRGVPEDGADARAGLLATWMAVEARTAALNNSVLAMPEFVSLNAD